MRILGLSAMRGKASYFPSAPTSPVAKGAALALLLSGIAFVLVYPSLAAPAAPVSAPPASAPARSTWSNIKRRETAAPA